MSSLPIELDFDKNRAATPARMNMAMDYLIARLKAVESLAPGIEKAIDTLNTIGLDRISAILVPLSEQANAIVDDLATIKAEWESDNTFDNAVAAATAAVTDAFADYRHRYLGARAAPPTVRDDGTPVDVGDMYFDTAQDQMRVLGSAGWKNAGSSVAGILNQISPMTATAGQTVFSIAGGYDVGYLIVTVNGSVIAPTNYTATDGTSITFGSGLNAGDKVSGIAFGAVTLSSIYTRAQVDAAFALIGASYTKAESDARYALIGASFTTAQSDSRYAKNDLSNLPDAAAARASLGVGAAGTRSDSYFARTANNLSDLANIVTARGNLGLGSIATYAATAFVAVANNLSDIANPASARSNLGLGSIATYSATAFAAVANNLSDIANPASARSNLGLGSVATHAVTEFPLLSNNLADLPNAATARTNLGLKSGATVNVTVSTTAPSSPAEGDVWINA